MLSALANVCFCLLLSMVSIKARIHTAGVRWNRAISVATVRVSTNLCRIIANAEIVLARVFSSVVNISTGLLP